MSMKVNVWKAALPTLLDDREESNPAWQGG